MLRAVSSNANSFDGLVNSVTGSLGQVFVNGTIGTPQGGDLTLTLPQSISNTSTPQFAGALLTGKTTLTYSSGTFIGAYGDAALTINAAIPRVEMMSSGAIYGLQMTANSSNIVSLSSSSPTLGYKGALVNFDLNSMLVNLPVLSTSQLVGTDGSKNLISTNLSGDVSSVGFATTITNSAVTYSKIQDVSANNRLLGRASSGAGIVEEIIVGGGLTVTGSTLSNSGTTSVTGTANRVLVNGLTGTPQTGDVTLSAPQDINTGASVSFAQLNLSSLTTTKIVATDGSKNLVSADLSGDVSSSGLVTTIGTNKVTLAQMAQVATASFLGRNTAGIGNVEVLNAATAKTMLGLSGTNSGDVTLAGESYLSLAGQLLTANSVDLGTTNITGVLPVNHGGNNTATQQASGVIFNDGTKNTSNLNLLYNGISTISMQNTIATANLTLLLNNNTAGSANETSLVMRRGDQANGTVFTEYFTYGSPTQRWRTGYLANDDKYYIQSISATALTITAAGVINIPNLTASQVVGTNGSKDLISMNFTDANTANAIVARDGSGNFSAGTITASLLGNASTATALQTTRRIGGTFFDGTADIVPLATQTVDEASDTSCYILFAINSGSQIFGQQPKTNGNLTYNSNSNILGSISFAVNSNIAGNMRMNDSNIQLRGTPSSSDSNHGLGWYGTGKLWATTDAVDGPVLFGFSGGRLGSTNGGQKTALSWNNSQVVTLPGLTASRLIQTDSGQALTSIANGTNAQVLHGDLTWSAVSLTTDVSGTLAQTNGGTGLSSCSQGDIFYGSASNTISALAKNASSTRYLSNTGSSNNPVWAQINLTNGVTGIGPIANGFTNASAGNFYSNAGAQNGIVYYNATRLASASDFTYDPTQAILDITSGSSNPGVSAKTSVTGSANVVFLSAIRGDTANGSSQLRFQVGNTNEWYLATFSGSQNLVVSRNNNATTILTLSYSDNSITANSGDFAIATAGKTIKIKEGSNACKGTGATMVAGVVTVNTTAVATGDQIVVSRTTAAGTLGTGMPTQSIVNGTSFTLTSSSLLETSTYSWSILKAA